MRGQAAEVADTLDWLETTIREFESAQHIVFGLGSVALARAALGQNDRAAALLAEIEASPDARGDENYAAAPASDGAHRSHDGQPGTRGTSVDRVSTLATRSRNTRSLQ